MGYKIFYAYQSDIDPNLNKDFIRAAIVQAISEITEYEIEPVIVGSQNSGGNPPLLQTILNESEEADLLIADLTYTSSKIWHNVEVLESTTVWKVVKLPTGDLKPSPNPNVLIETGYSWAKKGYDRTILVMNTAYGRPEELPVDLKGLVHPIKYNLSNESSNCAHSKQLIFQELTFSIKEAISKGIKADLVYLQKKLWPLTLVPHWESSDFEYNFILTAKARSVITNIRNAIKKKKNHQRIIGRKGCGRTRLAYELFRSKQLVVDKNLNLNDILYFDLAYGGLQAIGEQLNLLKQKNQNKILILDNCDDATHEIIVHKIFYQTNNLLISLGDADFSKIATEYLDNNYSDEIIKTLFQQSSKVGDETIYLKACQGYISSAIRFVNSDHTLDSWKNIEYFKDYWVNTKSAQESKTLYNLIEELSLFTFIGISGRYKEQLKYLIQSIGFKSEQELEQQIFYLINEFFIKASGDFISLTAFTKELAKSKLTKLMTEQENISDFFTQLRMYNLTDQFSNKLVELINLPEADRFFALLTETKGLLSKFDFINTYEGSKILLTISEINPAKALVAIQNALSELSVNDLNSLEEGRRNIVWALERIVYHPDLFEEAAELLFRLSQAENEFFGNNATNQFTQLFQAYIPATGASLSQRLEFLQQKKDQLKTEKEIEIFKSALDRALKTRHLVRMSGAEKQAGKIVPEYFPQNTEALEYFGSIIKIVVDIEAYELLETNFYNQFSTGNKAAILEAIENYLNLKKQFSPTLRQQFEFCFSDQKKYAEEDLLKLRILLKQYPPKSKWEKLIQIVARPPISHQKTEEGNIIDKSAENAKNLAREVAKDIDDWLPDFGVILKEDQNQTYVFGEELGIQLPNNTELIDHVVLLLNKVPEEKQNLSLIMGYLKSNNNEVFTRSTIDKFLRHLNILQHTFRLTRLLNIEKQDIAKLKAIASETPNLVPHFRYFRLDSIDDAGLIEFLKWIKSLDPFGWWTSINLAHVNLRSRGLHAGSDLLNFVGLLLKDDRFFKDRNTIAVGNRHSYISILEAYCQHQEDDELISLLSKEIISLASHYHLYLENEISQILDILFEKFWQKAWPFFSNAILNESYSGWYYTKEYFIRCHKIDQNKLFKWAQENPERAPGYVLEIVEWKRYDGEKSTFTPIVYDLIDAFPENQKLLKSLRSELRAYSTADVISLLESRKAMVETLLNHHHENIRTFAKEQVDYFENEIKREKRSQANSSWH